MDSYMGSPAKLNLKIYQGSTFTQALRWESTTKVYKPITNIDQSAPTVITAVGHGVPVGWRFRVTNVVGMKDINCTDGIYYTATNTTSDSITINALNSLAFSAYISGGIVEYNMPVNLTGYTARMQIRDKLDSIEVLKELTTENGGIIINTTDSTITIKISATDSAAMSYTGGVYSIELISSMGEVTQLTNGSVSVIKEVTR